MNQKVFMLVNGMIPAHTECGFQQNCEVKATDHCIHTGAKHPSEFECPTAKQLETTLGN
jgi:hypothetical protein